MTSEFSGTAIALPFFDCSGNIHACCRSTSTCDHSSQIYTYWVRATAGKVKTPKGMDDALLKTEGDEANDLRNLIQGHIAAETVKLEQEIFTQRTRLVTAERKLATRSRRPPPRASASRESLAQAVAYMAEHTSSARARLQCAVMPGKVSGLPLGISDSLRFRSNRSESESACWKQAELW